MGLPAQVFRYFRHLVSSPNPEALWVFGMQKSGTSVISALLAAKTGKSLQLDTKYLWEPFSKMVKNGELSVEELANKYSYDFSKEIIKEPSATFFIKHIDSFFELNQYVFIVRNPYDTIRSILNRLDLAGDQQKIEVEDVVPSWRYLYREMQGRDYIAVMARRWVQANYQPRWIESDRCVLVKYEDFNKEKEPFIEDLADVLGMPKKKDISHLLDKDFQPRGNSNVDLKVFFGKRNYDII
ncbi:sulfotransferase, partial [Phaeodactylibacter luteus]